jgi:hypothetical protein
MLLSLIIKNNFGPKRKTNTSKKDLINRELSEAGQSYSSPRIRER